MEKHLADEQIGIELLYRGQDLSDVAFDDIDLFNIKNIKVLASSTEINAKFIEKLDNF